MNIPLDRLKSQLLISGLQQENFALFQVINQLIDSLRQTVNAVNTALTGSSSGGGGGGTLGATYLTKNKEVLLPNSLQTIAGSGIQFNDAGGKRIISTALPFAIDGEQGEDGFSGNVGEIGPRGFTGKDGIPGYDAEDGIDGLSIPGPIGPIGPMGIQGISGLDGFDGEPGESLIPGPQGPEGPTGTSAGRIYYLEPQVASDIAGYKVALERIPSALPETTSINVLGGTADTLLYAFATGLNIPNITSIPAGGAFRHIHSKVGGITETARYKVELYDCNFDGSGETLIRSSYSYNFSNNTIAEIDWDLYDANHYILTVTQRLVYKLYVARVSGPANITVTTYFDGTANASYIQSTIAAGSAGAQGIQGIQGIMGFPGLDGDEGLDNFISGPQGIQGIPGVNGIIGKDGIGIPGLDAEEPEYPHMIPGPIGLTGPAGGGSSLDVMASRIQMRL